MLENQTKFCFVTTQVVKDRHKKLVKCEEIIQYWVVARKFEKELLQFLGKMCVDPIKTDKVTAYMPTFSKLLMEVRYWWLDIVQLLSFESVDVVFVALNKVSESSWVQFTFGKRLLWCECRPEILLSCRLLSHFVWPDRRLLWSSVRYRSTVQRTDCAGSRISCATRCRMLMRCWF